MKVLSLCRELPTVSRPAAGIHVARRLQAMNEYMDLTVLEVPLYFPWLRPKLSDDKVPDEFSTLNRHRSSAIYLPGFAREWHGWFMSRAIKSFLREHGDDFDLVDAHFGYPEGVAAFEAISSQNVPLAITFRGLETDLPRTGLLAARMRRALEYALHCICVSDSLVQVARELGASEEKITVVPNAVDSERFSPGERTEARNYLDLPKDVPVLVCVGHLRDVKRQHILLESFKHTLVNHPNSQLYLLGNESQEPEYVARLKSYVLANGISDHVHFCGALSSDLVYKYLVASNLFVLLSRREGSCNAVLEALATGIPAIVTRAGENADVIHDGQNGFLVKYDDVGDAVSAIDKCLSMNFNPLSVAGSISHRNWDRLASGLQTLFTSKQGKVRCISR